ncbi:glycosyltransferase family 2 protein [Nordella sp. HKS 07]|uniref:glycosyltransferase family 2 protein n=1 Tax=Nordella sp. HKS 07 TaxID=2712222 RepID=UPI0013E14D6B|nr:glycosyltransferase family 2 protein [Nordella sp. HKS 07]QIG48815.1 glycosyltransferase family 2 protein [Nordella sp. HKS 07]
MNRESGVAESDASKGAPDRIAVIVINWNGWQHTLDCVNSLRKMQREWHLFLVDNASSDDSIKHLSDLGEKVTLIQSPVNGGWTGGNNLGIQRALDLGYDHFFILNNDAEVLEDTLDVLEKAFLDRQDEMPILGPVHTVPDGSSYSFVGQYIDDLTGMPRKMTCEGVTRQDLDSVYETAYIQGAGLFVHRRHFVEIGFFDDAFYLDYDEADWSFRARRAGFRSYMVRDAVIRHIGSASIGGEVSPLNVYFLTRNGLLFSERHGNLRQRYRVWCAYYRRARRLVRGKGRRRWLWLPRFFKSRDNAVVAFRRGLMDYALRRFGDCSLEIRLLK